MKMMQANQQQQQQQQHSTSPQKMPNPTSPARSPINIARHATNANSATPNAAKTAPELSQSKDDYADFLQRVSESVDSIF
jgi:hypothetical protein